MEEGWNYSPNDTPINACVSSISSSLTKPCCRALAVFATLISTYRAPQFVYFE